MYICCVCLIFTGRQCGQTEGRSSPAAAYIKQREQLSSVLQSGAESVHLGQRRAFLRFVKGRAFVWVLYLDVQVCFTYVYGYYSVFEL